jgi:hypothetical protein
MPSVLRRYSYFAVKKFNDVDFVVQQPETMDEDDIKNCDPNNILRIDLQRPPEWFLSTWKTHIKPKYKLTISRWEASSDSLRLSENARVSFLFCLGGTTTRHRGARYLAQFKIL